MRDLDITSMEARRNANTNHSLSVLKLVLQDEDASAIINDAIMKGSLVGHRTLDIGPLSASTTDVNWLAEVQSVIKRAGYALRRVYLDSYEDEFYLRVTW